MAKKFYVCSYGGSGSKMLCNALKQYGKTYHIHSRNPPKDLEFIGNEGGRNTYEEWFNGKKIPQDFQDEIYVIFIYKNPVNAILSRFEHPAHLEHIQTNKNIKLADVIREKKDLYGIQEFYSNYIKNKNERNYKIYAVKYEELFEKHDELSKILQIGPLVLNKKETKRNKDENTLQILKDIYKETIQEMSENDFIKIT